MPEKESAKFMTPNELGAHLGVTARTVRVWIKNKAIAATRINERGRLLIPRSEIDRITPEQVSNTK